MTLGLEFPLRQARRMLQVGLFCLLIQPVSGWGKSENKNVDDKTVPAPDFRLRHDPDRPRGFLAPPLLSLILPGFDQWWESQYDSAVWYSGVAAAGLTYASVSSRESGASAGKLEDHGIAERKVLLGGLIYQGAGGMSAYHSFRTAVRSQKAQGNFAFLTHEESPSDILTAPFRFEFLARKTTNIPLAIAATLYGLAVYSQPSENSTFERDKFTWADAAFSGAFSYNAGTHEEAVFRGWLMPVLMHYINSPFWSNTGTAALFAASHLPNNPAPWPQFLLGWHMGYVTQERNWTISEAVFIHTWWNVFAFATQYSLRKKDEENTPAVLWLPPMSLNF